jgi:hypothetical protein
MAEESRSFANGSGSTEESGREGNYSEFGTEKGAEENTRAHSVPFSIRDASRPYRPVSRAGSRLRILIFLQSRDVGSIWANGAFRRVLS